ncbi:cache domain-containing sensor histidine kinase [Clostridium diolis]|uniref:cache domain-containing sensor histidine kinase n=1 Tax=Clostridium diolis TaxID=223919 RepID=UPI003AF5ACC5
MSEKVQMYNYQLINQINTNIDSKLMIYNNLTRQIYSNKEIIENMKKSYHDSYEKSLIEKSVSDVMLSLINVDKYILSAYVITSDGDVFYNGYGTSVIEDDYSNIEEMALEADGRVVWIPTQKNQAVFNELAFSATREIKTQDGSRAGTLVIILKEAFFEDLYKNVNLRYKSNNFIVSDDLTVVSSINKDMIGKKLDDKYLQKAVNLKNGSFIEKIEDQENFVVFSTSTITGWTFVSTIPVKELLKEVYSIRDMLIMILIIFIIFLAFLCYILPRSITMPIKKLSQTIQIVQKGCFTVSVENTNNDEIGSLSRSFNVMIKKLNELVLEVKEKEKEKSKAELVALQSQINPHFMYNTLNSIKFIAGLNKQTAIKNMVTSLINLLKNVAKNSDGLISLEEEMSLLQDYIYIQNIRFGNFNIVYHVPEEYKMFKIIKFTLQPIIENSIIHGFSEKGMFGEIHIYAFIKNDKLYIEVKDNGTGMEKEILTDLFKKEEGGDRYSKMGIKNINDRIVLNYGENYGLKVSSELNNGTTVTIVLPILEEVK